MWVGQTFEPDHSIDIRVAFESTDDWLMINHSNPGDSFHRQISPIQVITLAGRAESQSHLGAISQGD